MGLKTVKTGTVGDVISRGQVALATGASHRCPRQVYDWAWRTSWSGETGGDCDEPTYIPGS